MIARKLAVLFGFNHGVRPFYAACLFDELSRWSVSCRLNRKAISQRHNLIFRPKSMTMAFAGAIRGEYSPDGGVQWHLGAMRLAPYRLIRMAIEMASESAAFFSLLFVVHNRS